MKILKIIFLNILVFVLLFGAAEYVCRKDFLREYADVIALQSKLNGRTMKDYKFYYPVKNYDYDAITQNSLTKVYKGNSKKRPVITIGCSYVKGIGLEDNQTFAYKLNKYTGRTTYNRGIGGTGPQMVYRQLSDKNFTKQIPDAEYVIYVFIYNHVDRLFPKIYGFFSNEVNLNYELKNGELKELKHHFSSFYFFHTVKKFIAYQALKERTTEQNNNRPLFFKIMEESAKAAKKNYPDAKFVFVEFPEAFMCKSEYAAGTRELSAAQIKRLEDSGIIYINAEQLVGHDFRDVKKYRLADEDHPNERVWDEIVPALSRKLKL